MSMMHSRSAQLQLHRIFVFQCQELLIPYAAHLQRSPYLYLTLPRVHCPIDISLVCTSTEHTSDLIHSPKLSVVISNVFQCGLLLGVDQLVQSAFTALNTASGIPPVILRWRALLPAMNM